MKKAISLLLAISIALAVILFWQSNKASDIKDKRGIITTIYPIYYITKEIVGNNIKVNRLIKAGSEIHSFSPTPQDMVLLSKSELLITLGESLEPWVSKLSNATHIDTLSLFDNLNLIHHKEHIDPHIWLDFNNDIKIIESITNKLSKLYPSYSETFSKNATTLKKKFKDIDKQYRDGLKGCNQDTILVTHNAFGYMERNYGFKSKSIMGIFAHSKPNASKIAQLSNSIKEDSIKIMFFDPMSSHKSAKQLATDMSLSLMPLYPIGNISIDDEKNGEDIFTLLSKNLVSLKRGLECP
ncbi:Candidate zinc-binding lipoprotein ZinT [hydrothermal vent metagenome]|uniref:Candidate zinc-binding lipoprotein ZinT n=1 Tax=hydrothermal vent metagenome TaxID=652676 RepID=A0A1W1CEL8_9ZZZZ